MNVQGMFTINNTSSKDGGPTMVTTTERPSLAGVYPVGDAVALIQATRPATPANLSNRYRLLEAVSTRHLFRWVRDGMTGRYLTGLRGKNVALTFLDLVSLRLIAVFRAHGVTSTEIRNAHHILQQARGWSHPFAMEPIWISGLRIYVRENNIPIAPTRYWQAALEFVELFVGPVHNLAFGENEHAKTWEPEEGIVLDPKVSFGEPCLKGTRIATQVLWALTAAGDPPERIAQAYQIPVARVEAALAWERKLGYNGTS